MIPTKNHPRRPAPPKNIGDIKEGGIITYYEVYYVTEAFLQMLWGGH